MQSGRWRVDVNVTDGRTLGRIPFTITPVDTPVRRFAFRYYE